MYDLGMDSVDSTRVAGALEEEFSGYQKCCRVLVLFVLFYGSWFGPGIQALEVRSFLFISDIMISGEEAEQAACGTVQDYIDLVRDKLGLPQ